MGQIELTKGRFAIVDDQDYKWLTVLSWCLKTSSSGPEYAKTRMVVDGQVIYPTMHQLILGDLDGFQIDHINRDGLDNRRCNLRHVNKSDQMRNRNKFKGKSSKYKGVSFRKDNGRWSAYTLINGKQKHAGFFSTEIEAAKAVREYFI